MVTGHFLLLSYRFDNAIIDFLNPQVVTFKKMHDSIDHQKNRSGPKSRSEVADYYKKRRSIINMLNGDII